MTSTLPLGTPIDVRTDDDLEPRREYPAPRHVRVPWSHVLPLAVVLSFANGFWLISLRGAAGAIERTSDPFESWLRESTLLVPAYIVAVVAAFALGHRWFGPRPRGFGRTSAALALVAGASTLVGLLVQAASSVLDFRLQVEDLNHMQVHAACGPDCISERVQATWHLEAKALLIGLVLLAVTDLVIVALVYAARGGNLLVGSTRAPSRFGRWVADVTEPRLVLATALFGAALIHAAVTPEHLREWTAAGAFFVVLTLAEAAATVAVLVEQRAIRQRTLWAAVIALSVLPLSVWLVSRTAGLPIGPAAGEPEVVGVADVMSCVLELTAALIAVRLLRRTSEREPWSRYALGVAIAALLTATTLGLAGSTLPVVGAFPAVSHHHDAQQEIRGAPAP